MKSLETRNKTDIKKKEEISAGSRPGIPEDMSI
jgi:hypothetical protein